MQCHDISETLSAYIDGMLDSSYASRVEEHMESCAQCRMEYDDLCAVVGLIRELPEVAPPPGFGESLRQRLRAAEPESKTPTAGFFKGRWLGMLAAAVVFLTVGVTALWNDGKGGLPFGPVSQPKTAGESEIMQKQVAHRENENRGPASEQMPMAWTGGRDTVESGYAGSLEPAASREAQRPSEDTGGEAEQTPATGVGYFSDAKAEDETADSTQQKEEDSVSIMGGNGESEFFVGMTPEEEADSNAAPPDLGKSAGTEPGPAMVYAITLGVGDGKEAEQRVIETLMEYGGVVEQQVIPGKELILQVPVTNAEKFLDQIEKLGRVSERFLIQENPPSAKQLQKAIDLLTSRQGELARQVDDNGGRAAEEELENVGRQLRDLREKLAALNAKDPGATTRATIRVYFESR
ncbi:MAG: zf-HC2 domain-containing protein [Firmicutes bacterium]|nr:zf-HC2 domain-containing protein [Bacillota bacterium]